MEQGNFFEGGGNNIITLGSGLSLSIDFDKELFFIDNVRMNLDATVDFLEVYSSLNNLMMDKTTKQMCYNILDKKFPILKNFEI